MTEKLKYARTALDDATLSDILNDNKAKELQQRGWFSSENDFGIMCGFDGATLFKHTSIQAWSLWGFIAYLSPKERSV